jgi:hypothetical protein
MITFITCIPQLKWAGQVAHMGQKRNVYRGFVEKPKGQTPFGKPTHTWKENIKLDLKETGWGSLNSIHLAQDKK